MQKGMDGDANSMNGTIGSINLHKDHPDLTGHVHQLPCCIKYDGHCAVSHYFKPKTSGLEVDGLSIEEAYFRGRKLHGAKIALPSGYSGFVLGKKTGGKRRASDKSEPDSNYWETNAKFSNITYWNHESVPSGDDAFLCSFHWLSVGEALHRPVTSEDLASATVALKKTG